MTDAEVPGRPHVFDSAAAAADACSVSVRTVRRYLSDDRIPGAEKVDGQWRIPASGLVAAGLEPGRPAPPPRDHVDVAAVEAERDSLRREVSAQRARAEVAEALAADRAEHVADLRRSIEDLRRQLPPAPPAGDAENRPAGATDSTPAPDPEPASRWRRLVRAVRT